MLRTRAVRILGVTAALAVVLIITRQQWLSALGGVLVNAGEPKPADAVFVLGGDFRGERLSTAVELAQRHLVSKVLVSGPVEVYGVNEADLAIAQAVKRGADPDLFVPIYTKALSTSEECARAKTELLRQGLRSVLVVTSNFHTARSYRVFRSCIGSDIRVQMVAAPDKYFTPDGWWKTREGQKTFFFEFCKTIAHFVGL